jgi:hypothetical protein
VTDEEGREMKAPGVVARLMGLDALPTSGIPEPYRTHSVTQDRSGTAKASRGVLSTP